MPSSTPSTTPSTNPKTHTCFFYGTLMAPSILSRVTAHPPSRPLHVRPALLLHHRRHRVLDADYPAVIPVSQTAEACVRGTCVVGLTEEDVWRLDVFEGDEYVRVGVRVRILHEEAGQEHREPGHDTNGKEEGEEEMIHAETYIWAAPRSRLEDSEWDFEEFVREKMWRWDGGAERQEYVDIEAAVAEREKLGSDPTGGRAVNGGFEDAVGRGVGREVVESAV